MVQEPLLDADALCTFYLLLKSCRDVLSGSMTIFYNSLFVLGLLIAFMFSY